MKARVPVPPARPVVSVSKNSRSRAATCSCFAPGESQGKRFCGNRLRLQRLDQEQSRRDFLAGELAILRTGACRCGSTTRAQAEQAVQAAHFRSTQRCGGRHRRGSAGRLVADSCSTQANTERSAGGCCASLAATGAGAGAARAPPA
jgi:hypothetical protein